MKKNMFQVLLLALCMLSSLSYGQSCKPDISQLDKITKRSTQKWVQSLDHDRQFWEGSTSEIFAVVGSYGKTHAINVELKILTPSNKQATLGQVYRGAKGNIFSFGFDKGEPITFTATEVGNTSALGGFSGLATTIVVLAAHVSDKELAAIRNTLTTKKIDAVRIILEGNVIIEREVKEDRGEEMRQKFECFYQTLDKK
ncbi:MAG: hypothetical protein HXX17_10750 [Geobacteraceae bacterium]|nr:hypothetical protein [Geobacteraceae bacterium]